MVPLTVFELRNYVMQPGRRDDLITLFEDEFIESQEVLGSRVAGTFRNLDDPNRFVWLRGFETMETRARALDGFYTSELWRTHRNAANATMIDSDDVLQLRPLGDARWAWADRPPRGATAIPPSLIGLTTYFLRSNADAAFADFFSGEIAPALRDERVEIVATLATEHAPNSYPRLPIREDETVFAVITRHGAADHIPNIAGLGLGPVLQSHLIKPTETLRLQPTARSALR
jgi:hypothetical protein